MISGNKGCLDWTVFIHMLKQDSLTDWWFIMDSLTTITVSTGSDFIKEWTVDLIHLCTINFRKPLSHVYSL